DAIWESYRFELERLYIHEHHTLGQVMEYMESMYGFNEKKSQYTKYLDKWGLRKNLSLTESQGTFIGRRIDKRKREYQKESEVYINGVEWPPAKVQKSRYNKTYVSTVDGLPGAPSPNTPEGIVVCTPATPGMRLIWNPSLPWLQFSKLLKHGGDNDPSSPSSTLNMASPQSPGALAIKINPELMQRLTAIVPWKTLSNPPNLNSLSRIVAGLSILMPEEFPGQNRTLATRLCSTLRTTTESLNLELFLLSNNLIAHGPAGKSEQSMNDHDRNVMKLFSMSGWKNRKQIDILLATHQPTAEAIAEKLFASALRLRDLDTVSMMLEAGMDPDSRVDTFHSGPLTCLQIAANMGPLAIKVVELFLSHGADIDLSYNGYPSIYYAVSRGNHEVSRLFLSHNAIVTPSCLAIAAVQSDVSLFRQVLDRATDVNARSGWQDPSALAQAVSYRNLTMVDLLARGADMNTALEIDFDQDVGVTTVLGLAVRTKRLEIVQRILQACVNPNPNLDGLPYVSPLALAVEASDTKITQILLQAGIDVEIAEKCSKLSLLERALKRKNVEISRLLIDYGARLHMPHAHEQKSSSALLLAVQHGYYDIIDMLVQGGAPLNEFHGDAPGTVLAAAIEKGDVILILKLESAGATLVGPKLRKIGNLETGTFLEATGMLQNILAESGGPILTRAIFDEDRDLIKWLFAHNINIDGHSTEPGPRDSSGFPQTPLQAAIQTRNISFVEAMIARGTKVIDRDLAAVVDGGHISLLRRLLTGFRGLAPTAIGCAIVGEQQEALQLILEAGADPTGPPQLFYGGWYQDDGLDFEPEDPQSVLEIAAQNNDRSSLRALVQSCIWDKRHIGRALTIATAFQHTRLINDLLDLAVDTNQEIIIHYPDRFDEYDEEISGWDEVLTPLQAAAKNQLLSTVQWLIKSPHTNIEYLGEGVGRRTALQHAVNNGNMDLINLLLDHGADVNTAPSEDGGATALQIAAIQGYLGIARKLIDLDADVNAAPARRNGRTALEGAAEHGRIDMLRLLLDEGALLVGDHGERQCRRAVELAEKNGHIAAAKLLKSFK
ncbi:ankyrin, partial [Aspergillus steynii IBT 23096]